MGVKLCISSRRSTPLRQTLETCPGFAIHDLTFSDIRLYVGGRVPDICKLRPVSINDEGQRELTETITYKAQGVFLWVHLVLRNITKGMYFYDSLEELLDRIKELPDEIHALYEDMLTRIGPDLEKYQREASLCLHTCLSASEYPGISALQMMFMMSSLDRQILSQACIHFPISELVKKSAYNLARLESICGGLLHVHEIQDARMYKLTDEMLWMCR